MDLWCAESIAQPKRDDNVSIAREGNCQISKSGMFRRKPLPGLLKKVNSRLDGSDGAFHLLSNQPFMNSRSQ
jgi:hypothetical protein